MKNLFLFFILLILTNCKSSSDRQFIELYQNKLNFIPQILPLEAQSTLENNTYKIVTIINGYCTSCLDEFRLWYELKQKYEQIKNTPIIYYVCVEDIEIIKPWIKKYKLTNTVIDKQQLYLKENNLYNYKSHLHTFLINNDNNIVLIGNPIYNPKVLNLYLKNISRANN